MENSPLIAPSAFSDDLYVFAKGYGSESRNTPAHVAWALESAAVRYGWPVGRLLGSERDLIERFGVSRDALREAIRVVEARGSMRMQRGCKGGLRLLRPHLDQAAGALAAYLRACGCSDAELAETASVAAPILASLDDDDLFICLYRRTITLLASGETAGAGGTVRGTVIATRLIRHGAPIPEEGAYLGSEADLCAKFSCGRSTFRQALRILDDLGMLHVRRGRGGGYALKRPSSIGVVRQLFALLASRQQTLENIIPVVWALNLVNLRLAMHRFRQLSPGLRAERCDGLAALLVQSSEPRRWGLLQQALSRAANNTMVSTLLRCMVAYHARLGPPPAVHSELDEQLRTDEEAIVQALRRGRDAEAESHHRRAQARLSQMFHCSDLPGSEHAFLGHA